MGGRGGKRKGKERRGGGKGRSITLGQVTSNHTTQYGCIRSTFSHPPSPCKWEEVGIYQTCPGLTECK